MDKTQALPPFPTDPSSIVLLACCLLVGYSLAVFQRKKTHNYPPHPLPCHFLWGNGAEFPRPPKHPDPKLLEWAKELGPVFSVRIPVLGRMIIVADPELIHHVTVSKNFHKSWTLKNVMPIFGDRSILLVHGEEWKRYRKAFAPGFTPNFLRDMTSVMLDKLQRCTKALDDDAQNERATNMMECSQTFTSDVIVQIAFGEDWGGGKEPHVARQYLDDMLSITNRLGSDPVAKLFGFGMKRRLRSIEGKLNQVMEEILDRRLKQTEEGDSAESRSSDVCSLAMKSMKQPDGSLSREDRKVVIHQLKTFYFAGHDTTATLISWVVWLLSQHPQVLAKLRDELASQKIFITPDDRPTYDGLQKCDYLDAIVKEVLRLYPPGASARYTFDTNETWNGHTIGGAVLYVNCYVAHRLPQYWDRPDDFLPERFVGVSPESYKHKYIPFLKGPRDCLGRYFALLEAKLAISALAQRYDMKCVDANETIGYRLTAHPFGGAKVRLTI
eukprot:CAMPEP_0183710996 /NCGR_PEP_ID=MMETSP0737-20130205/6597_1 /TAXON_ID=385413 /ORGANISM="Thalassiosira miniscula, Strain CCMP1093" /LENGTH=497 /DNA_ID=CAMNT_0025939387 /DNA_START=161 /DNA_END=1651 /DNA_ORIENTATION=-